MSRRLCGRRSPSASLFSFAFAISGVSHILFMVVEVLKPRGECGLIISLPVDIPDSCVEIVVQVPYGPLFTGDSVVKELLDDG